MLDGFTKAAHSLQRSKGRGRAVAGSRVAENGTIIGAQAHPNGLAEVTEKRPHVSRSGDRDSFVKPVASGIHSSPISPSPTGSFGKAHLGTCFGSASRRRPWRG